MDSAPPAPDDGMPSTAAAGALASDEVPPSDKLEPPRNFSWVERDLGAMAWPGSGAELESAATWLDEHGVDLVITLTEAELDPSIMKAHGLSTLHLPIVDFTPPTRSQIEQFVVTIKTLMARDQRVVVHCAGGRGRTGTMMAAWFVAEGATADEAIARIRAKRPGSIETAAQEDAVRDFAASLGPRH